MISFKSVENFFEECTTGIEFKYEENGISSSLTTHLQVSAGFGYICKTKIPTVILTTPVVRSLKTSKH